MEVKVILYASISVFKTYDFTDATPERVKKEEVFLTHEVGTTSGGGRCPGQGHSASSDIYYLEVVGLGWWSYRGNKIKVMK